MDLMLERPEGPRHVYAYTGGKAFDPHLPTVVFLHGALFDHSAWTLPARWFAHHGHSVLAPDLPGHARSHGEALASVEALADWTLALLDAAGNDAPVSVDGGVDHSNAHRIVAAGAGILIAGQAIFGRGDAERATRELRARADGRRDLRAQVDGEGPAG